MYIAHYHSAQKYARARTYSHTSLIELRSMVREQRQNRLYSQSRCFFLGPIISSVVALQTDFARPCPAMLCLAASSLSLIVCPAILSSGLPLSRSVFYTSSHTARSDDRRSVIAPRGCPPSSTTALNNVSHTHTVIDGHHERAHHRPYLTKRERDKQCGERKKYVQNCTCGRSQSGSL